MQGPLTPGKRLPEHGPFLTSKGTFMMVTHKNTAVWLNPQGTAFWDKPSFGSYLPVGCPPTLPAQDSEAWMVGQPVCHGYSGTWQTALPPSWACCFPSCVSLTLAPFSVAGQEGTRTSKSHGFLKPPPSSSSWSGSEAPTFFSPGDHTYLKGRAAPGLLDLAHLEQMHM